MINTAKRDRKKAQVWEVIFLQLIYIKISIFFTYIILGMEDIFSMFGGGGGGPRMQQQGAKKTKPVMKEVQVKLEEVF